MMYLPLLRILQSSPFYVQIQPKFLQCPIRPLTLGVLLSTLTPFFTSLPFLQVYWLPCYFSNMSSTLPPQGLCSCYSPKYLHVSFPHFAQISPFQWSLLTTLFNTETYSPFLPLTLSTLWVSWWGLRHTWTPSGVPKIGAAWHLEYFKLKVWENIRSRRSF